MDTAICLMGPTASCKTDIAVRLASVLPVDVISVDSALVYRGMDIGTAKPGEDILRQVPHRLIDIRDPEQAYSAGEFVRDARREIERSLEAGRVPLLAGGTMMYFRALTQGIAELPEADAGIRVDIDSLAARIGWEALHDELVGIDPEAAERIRPTDSQRIQRALEVYRASGKTLTEWQSQTTAPANPRFVKLALLPALRETLHERIRQRLEYMMKNGFVEEVQGLKKRPGLSAESSSMRAVGYRQIWSYLDGQCGLDEAQHRALYATRQLAKRQITWLRSETDLPIFDPLEEDAIVSITSFLRKELDL
ncbi:MAG: tRNA (adenosine(37)-N6)-dimethylallyltransferase MiaA [Gammaproteobacteria bacterium]|nr:tRNA (adenosine(37)-N6)-dimethylallyltransferase MiaA [Gammaproteobacteria bacterium]MDH4315130.1 tRNA (adenosine(37)-N6)-dimethylallyltransferase MiaA [Gammaproteobacteria bacterium]MDH5214247.1 tRNA (adenosine(37)-N6)-dimethylallyltransferase MiaA [Gammaproteobacteria bacterium]